MSFNTNIFVNCPFDDDYYSLLKPLVFTTIYCGLNPRIAETADGDDIRIRQIQQLIKESRYSIHDISRILPKAWEREIESKENKEEKDYLPRFNMPFELGLDLGCKHFHLQTKRCLILEEKPYRYKQVISDIAGQDISSHENRADLLIKVVRNWIYLNTPRKPDAHTAIWDLYNEFAFDFNTSMRAEKMDPEKLGEIPFSELIDLVRTWIKNKKKTLRKQRGTSKK